MFLRFMKYDEEVTFFLILFINQQSQLFQVGIQRNVNKMRLLEDYAVIEHA